MKKNVVLWLSLFFILCGEINLKAESRLVLGFSYKLSESHNWGYNQFIVTNVFPYSPAYNSGIKVMDVITHINDEKVEAFPKGTPLPLNEGENKLTIRRWGEKAPIEIKITPVPIPDNSVFEYELLQKERNWLSFNKNRYGRSKGGDYYHFKYNLMCFRDPEIDMLNYHSFDFEYISENEPLIEKEIAVIIQKQLEKIGLVRDKSTPDFLIIIDFHSGKEEEYISPRTDIRTRYGTTYNLLTKRWETRQYVESDTREGYTESDYWGMLKLVFLDSKKAKEGNTSPMFWQAEYSEEGFRDNVNIKNFAKNSVPQIFKHYYSIDGIDVFDFIKSSEDEYITYGYDGYFPMGICFDKTIENKVNVVLQDSPADKAGIKPGDIIFGMNKSKLPKEISYSTYSDYLLQNRNPYSVIIKRDKGKMRLNFEVSKIYFGFGRP